MADTEIRGPGGFEPMEPTEATMPRNPGGSTPADFDRDVDIKAVVWTGVALAGVTAVAFVVAWFFYLGLARSSERRDPEPLPMPEAAQPMVPPGPRLQVTPEMDLKAYRAAEDAMLHGYGPVAGEEGYARIPIERAMALVAAPAGAPDEERSTEPAGLAGDQQVETPPIAGDGR